jgi:polyisoprenoid-binding protein YceI
MRAFRYPLAALAAALITAPAAAQAPATRPVVAAPATAATYLIDPVHSEVSFRIRHLLGRVAGTFGEWGGTVVMDTVDVARSSVNVTIQTASIDTRVKQRDDHLRTPDFFAADSFPTITFRSTGVAMEGRHIRVAGDLTIRGRTRPVVLAGTYEGIFPDPWGGTRVAFIASTTVNRQDFGVAFQGPFLGIGQIGDEVDISIAIEAVRQ